LSRNYLRALDTSANATVWNPNPDYYVYTILAFDNVLCISGDFKTIGGEQRPYLAILGLPHKTAANPCWNLLE
jgi:hypothetical protein